MCNEISVDPVTVCMHDQTLIHDDGQLNLNWKSERGNSSLLILGIWRDLHAVGETVYTIANSSHLKHLEAKGITPTGIKQQEDWLQASPELGLPITCHSTRVMLTSLIGEFRPLNVNHEYYVMSGLDLPSWFLNHRSAILSAWTLCTLASLLLHVARHQCGSSSMICHLPDALRGSTLLETTLHSQHENSFKMQRFKIIH